MKLFELASSCREKLNRFEEMLLETNKTMNLTRITRREEVHVRHFEDSLIIFKLLEELAYKNDGPLKLIDIGSGAGFPSIPLAIVMPKWEITSLEATGKKADFQRTAIQELGLTNVTVLSERAEKLAHQPQFREQYTAVTSRAVGSMAMLAEMGVPFLKIGGKLFLWKGAKGDEELAAGNKRADECGALNFQKMPYRLGGEESHLCIMTAAKVKPTPGNYPREFPIIKSDS